ncbi:Uncharacterized protein APZ42_005959 [Daphnia magna]|uniref:Uncharacterized protein n=1 Tax=Daphnia magna TaxID=35525 RepID=A0A0N8DU33_9CRUS|nr:Uncharacterized protein APZ42_005959 [Daphnia magna]
MYSLEGNIQKNECNVALKTSKFNKMINMTTYNTYIQQFVQRRIQMPHHTICTKTGYARYGRVMSSASSKII